MLAVLLLVVALVLIPIPTFAQSSCVSAGAGLVTCTFTSGPHNARWYRMHVPAAGSGPRPLVVVLHGGGTPEDNSSSDIRTVANMETRGDLLNGGNGVIIAYPRGTVSFNSAYFWNIGPEACVAFGNCSDDIAFTNAVISDIKATQSVDAANVALAGHSAGGFVVLRMLCEPGGNPHASVAFALSASLTAQEEPLCTNNVKTRVFLISGTTDTGIPYTGGSLPALVGPPLVTLPIGYVAYQVIALRARGGNTSAGIWGTTVFPLDADGECAVSTEHLGPSSQGIPDSLGRPYNVAVFALGAGVSPPSGDGCNWENGMGHRWAGYAGEYGFGKKALVYDLSGIILSTVAP